jgi:hypothetical protein
MLGFCPRNAQCSPYTDYTILAREKISLYEDVISPVIACKGVFEGDCQQFLAFIRYMVCEEGCVYKHSRTRFRVSTVLY